MTSTNDGKDVKSNQTSGQKGKKYYIDLYNSLEARLSSECELRERTEHLCEAWRRIHSICRHALPASHPLLLGWLERHTATIVLQSEWQSPNSKDDQATFEATLDVVIQDVSAAVAERHGVWSPWETLLRQRAEWFKCMLGNPWVHPVLSVLLDPRGKPPSDEDVLEWLKGERDVVFLSRLRQLVASKCDDLATALATAVMDRVRAAKEAVPDIEQAEEPKDKPKSRSKEPPTFEDILRTDAGFTDESWALLIDIEFVLLHKGDRRSRCIELAKQTPLRIGYELVQRLQKRQENAKTSRDKRLWKSASEVATLIAQVVIARCMVVPVCGGFARTALYCCARALVTLLGAPALRRATVALAAPAATAAHLYWLARAVNTHTQITKTEEMKPFVCELYVRAITSGMNELEKLKAAPDQEPEARSAEQTLASWFMELGSLFAASARFKCECTLTAFSVHPSPAMYERIKMAPVLPPVAMDVQEPKAETTSEFGSWSTDSRAQTNFVKTSETLNIKHTQHQANVLSTTIVAEGESLGLGVDLCQDITVLLSGPRVKTLSWDMDRELLLEKCRTYMERTHGGTRALTTELKYLNLNPDDFQHLPEEEDDDTDMYYGIEKGYEHLVEFQEPQPEAIWDDAMWYAETTESTCSSPHEFDYNSTTRQKKSKDQNYSSEGDSDPLSLVAEAKKEKKKDRPHSKERSKERRKPKKDGARKEKKEKKCKIKEKADIPSEYKAGSLASLIGIKVARVPLIAADVKKEVNVTDSDYDSQGKSSITSEGNEADIVYDGQFSMDELKSPEAGSTDEMRQLAVRGLTSVKSGVKKATDPNKQGNKTKRNRKKADKLANPLGDLATNKKQNEKSKQTVVKKVTDSTITSANDANKELKKKIAKLMEFRRQKPLSMTPKPEPVIKQEFVPRQKPLSMTPKPAPVIKQESAPKQEPLSKQESVIKKTDMGGLISSKIIKPAETPNLSVQTQTEPLNAQTNEMNNSLSNPVIPFKPPLIKQQFVNNTVNEATITAGQLKDSCSRVLPIKYQYRKAPLNKPAHMLQNTTTDGRQLFSQTSQCTAPVRPAFDKHQKSFQEFLKELQGSINAGVHVNTQPKQTSVIANVKKEIKPFTEPTPVISNMTTKAEPIVTPQCAKPVLQQKKVENVPNTFARLSYMHKNKQGESKSKSTVDPLTAAEIQNQLLLQNSISAELDQRIADMRLNKLKYLHNISISKVDHAASTPIPKESPRVEVQKVGTVPQLSMASENPVLSNMLQTPASFSKRPNSRTESHTKNDLSEQSITMSTLIPTKSETTSLSEKDQQDLLALLRQQYKLNARANERTPAKPDPNTSKLINNLRVSNTLTISSNIGSSAYAPLLPTNANMKNKQQNTPTSHETVIIKNLKTDSKKMNSTTDLIQNKLNRNHLTPCENNNIKSPHNLNQGKDKSAQQSKIKVYKAAVDSTVTNLITKEINRDMANTKVNESKQDWASVLDAIRAHKTPSRGPTALDLAKKDSYQKYTNSLRNQRIVRNAAGEPNKVTNTVSNATQCHAGNIPQPPADIPAALNSKQLVVKRVQDVTKIQSETEMIKKPNRVDFHKNAEIPKKFTCKLQKDDDPFISGIPNSDYDLLEELMDDDLRQEIGELTDDDLYDLPAISNVSMNYPNVKSSTDTLKKPVGNFLNAEKCPVIVESRTVLKNQKKRAPNKPNTEQPVLMYNTPNKIVDSKMLKTPIPTTTGSSSKPQIISYERLPKCTTPVLTNDVTEHMPQNIVYSHPKSEGKPAFNVNNNVDSNKRQPGIDPTKVFITAVPRPVVQNVVVFDAYSTVQSQIHGTLNNVKPGSYVTMNSTPNLTVFKTQHHASAASSVIIGTTITLPPTTVPTATSAVPFNTAQSVQSTDAQAFKPSTTVATVISNQTIVNKISNTEPNEPKISKSVVQSDISKVSDESKLKSESLKFYNINLKDSKENLDFNSYKTVDRKILSIVHQNKDDVVPEKIDSKNSENQIHSFEIDMKKDALEEQERLTKKRLALINRDIYQHCLYSPIPLTYAPLRAPKLNVDCKEHHTITCTKITNPDDVEAKLNILDLNFNKADENTSETTKTPMESKPNEDIKNLDTHPGDFENAVQELNINSTKKNKNNASLSRRRQSNNLKGKPVKSKAKSTGRKTKVRLKVAVAELKEEKAKSDTVFHKDLNNCEVNVSVEKKSEEVSDTTKTVNTIKLKNSGEGSAANGETFAPTRVSRRILERKIKTSIEVKPLITEVTADKNYLLNIQDALIEAKIDKTVTLEEAKVTPSLLPELERNQDVIGNLLNIASNICKDPLDTKTIIHSETQETVATELIQDLHKINDKKVKINVKASLVAELPNEIQCLGAEPTNQTIHKENKTEASVNVKTKTTGTKVTREVPKVQDVAPAVVINVDDTSSKNEQLPIDKTEGSAEKRTNVVKSVWPQLITKLDGASIGAANKNNNLTAEIKKQPSTNSDVHTDSQLICGPVIKNKANKNMDKPKQPSEITRISDLKSTSELRINKMTINKGVICSVDSHLIKNKLNRVDEIISVESNSDSIDKSKINNIVHKESDKKTDTKMPEKKDERSEIPQSYKNSIQFEELPPPDANNPHKRCVRIKLPNGKTFKATVSGALPISFDSLFADPTLKNVLLSGFTDKKFYTLSISTPMNRVVDTRITEISLKNKISPTSIDTVNLISDDEDEDVVQNFTTEFGKYAVSSLDKDTLTLHQNKFSQKCVIKLNKCPPPEPQQSSTDIMNDESDATDMASPEHSHTETSSKACEKTKDDSLIQNLVDAFSTETIKNTCKTSHQENVFHHASNVGNGTCISEVIEIDDSSNDSIIIPDVLSTTAPVAKIHELKNMLLKDLGVDDIFNDDTTENDSDISDIKSQTKSTIHEKAQTRTNHDKDVIGNENICEDVNHDYSEIIQRKYFVKLVRCDENLKMINNNENKTNAMSDDEIVIGESDIEANILDRDTFEPALWRSGSFSILNEFALDDDIIIPILDSDNSDRNSPVIHVFETMAAMQNIHENERNSPVMEAFDTIASFYNSSVDNNNIKTENQPDLSVNNVTEYTNCCSDWLATKRNMHHDRIIVYTPINSDIEDLSEIIADDKVFTVAATDIITCYSEWYFTKHNLHYYQMTNKIKDIVKDPVVENIDVSTGYESNQDASPSRNSPENLSISVLSLSKIMCNYFKNNPVVNEIRSKQEMTRIKASTKLKRKICDESNSIDNRLPSIIVSNVDCKKARVSYVPEFKNNISDATNNLEYVKTVISLQHANPDAPKLESKNNLVGSGHVKSDVKIDADKTPDPLEHNVTEDKTRIEAEAEIDRISIKIGENSIHYEQTDDFKQNNELEAETKGSFEEKPDNSHVIDMTLGVYEDHKAIENKDINLRSTEPKNNDTKSSYLELTVKHKYLNMGCYRNPDIEEEAKNKESDNNVTIQPTQIKYDESSNSGEFQLKKDDFAVVAAENANYDTVVIEDKPHMDEKTNTFQTSSNVKEDEATMNTVKTQEYHETTVDKNLELAVNFTMIFDSESRLNLDSHKSEIKNIKPNVHGNSTDTGDNATSGEVQVNSIETVNTELTVDDQNETFEVRDVNKSLIIYSTNDLNETTKFQENNEKISDEELASMDKYENYEVEQYVKKSVNEMLEYQNNIVNNIAELDTLNNAPSNSDVESRPNLDFNENNKSITVECEDHEIVNNDMELGDKDSIEYLTVKEDNTINQTTSGVQDKNEIEQTAATTNKKLTDNVANHINDTSSDSQENNENHAECTMSYEVLSSEGQEKNIEGKDNINETCKKSLENQNVTVNLFDSCNLKGVLIQNAYSDLAQNVVTDQNDTLESYTSMVIPDVSNEIEIVSIDSDNDDKYFYNAESFLEAVDEPTNNILGDNVEASSKNIQSVDKLNEVLIEPDKIKLKDEFNNKLHVEAKLDIATYINKDNMTKIETIVANDQFEVIKATHDYSTKSSGEIDGKVAKTNVTLVYKDDSGVVLKGVECVVPIMGTCYVFPLTKSPESSKESDVLNTSSDSLVEVFQEIDGEIGVDETIKDSYDEINIKVITPRMTYSKRNLKRKANIMDENVREGKLRRTSKGKVATEAKRYKKAKNIDQARLSVAALNDSSYCKEYKRLFDYLSSIKFSYSVIFDKEYIDVPVLAKNWPIKGPFIEETQDKVIVDNPLFIDINNKTRPIFDPLQQTLTEEITAEYNETDYFSSETDKTNFNVGFGEGSDRVITNLVDGAISKLSAATLSDVKQSQPFLLSEDYDDCENEQTISHSNENQIENIKRYISYIRIRDKVRTFFKNTAVELNRDWIKENIKDRKTHSYGKTNKSFPFDLYITKSIAPFPIQSVVQVVQVGQLPVSAAAQNPITCDPRVTQVSDASPSQCSAENSPQDDSQPRIKTEYTELTTADLTLPLVQDYAQHNESVPMESQDNTNMSVMNNENIPIETELIKSEVKIELVEETPEDRDEHKSQDNNEEQPENEHNNVEYSYDTNNSKASVESDSNGQILVCSPDKQNVSEKSSEQKPNGPPEKTDQIAHAMNAAGITTTPEPETNNRTAFVNILHQNMLHGSVSASQNTTNTYPKATSINAMSLQQALAQILPPPLNQTNIDNTQQGQNTLTPQLLHIVQGKNASGNQITLVENTQQSIINNQNATPVLHILQNKVPGQVPNGNPQQNTFSGLSLVDAGLQQGGNQLLHILNTGNQKNSNAAGQLLKRVNLLTNLTNVQGANEQKMVQFVCKSADGKAIQLNASHQRSMVLRLQPIETPNVQTSPPKPGESQGSSPSTSVNSSPNTEASTAQQEIKSRSVYEENYAKFIQNSAGKSPVLEKSTSLPKFNQAFGKAVFQDGNQKQNEINGSLPPVVNTNGDNSECQPAENAINLEHIAQLSSPPLLLRKTSAQVSQPQANLVQQITQTIAPMNIQTMHGGVIYTRQIPVNIGGGQTINLITVPSTELIDDSGQKQQSDIKIFNQGEIEPSIIKIVPQANAEGSQDEGNNHMNVTSDNAQNPQSQPVLTQMRIKLPMLSKAPQMVSGARVVRPSFFQIQRNVIAGANQPVYQQLVLTAAPPLGQQTIRLPQAQTRQIKVPTDGQSSESQMSTSTLEQLREFDMVLEQVKERSTVQPNTTPNIKLNAPPTNTSDGPASSAPTETTQQVLYSIGTSQPLSVAYVNRKTIVSTPTTSTYVRSTETPVVGNSATTSHTRTVTSENSSNGPSHSRAAKVGSKSKNRPRAASNPPMKQLSTVPPKASVQKPLEDEQTTQRILYILAEYKEQVENSPDKDKPAPRRRSNPPSHPGSKRKRSSGSRRSGTRDFSPVHGDDSCRTMGSEDSSCGTSQGDCTENCLDPAHSPQDSPRKVVRKLTFEQEPAISQPRPQPPRNVIVADGQTITVARGTAGKPATAVLMPTNYILPVSMVKGGQQIAIVTNRGPKLLTVGGGEGGATNALLLQRLIDPAGRPVLARPGVRHVRLPTGAIHNLQTFNLTTTAATVQPSNTSSPAPASTATPPDLVETGAESSPWADRDSENAKPDRGSSPEGSEPWNLPSSADQHEYTYEETVQTDNMNRTVLDPIPDRYSPDMEAQRIFDKMFDVDSKKSYDSHDEQPRCGYDIDASDDDKAYHQVVQKKDGATHRHHRLTHVSAAALRHKYAILEHELRLQKSLSEECEDLGVDSPSAAELFPEAELLFSSSPAHDHTQEQPHHSHTPQPVIAQSVIHADIDDQIATDQLLPRDSVPADRQELDVNLGLEDVGIVTVSEDGMQTTITLDQEEFARSHPNTTFHSEPTDEGEVQPFTITGLKARHITSTIFHSARGPATVLMAAPQATVISQATGESGNTQNAVKYDLDNMINSMPETHSNNINLSSVLVKDDGLTRFDNILTDSRELHLSNTVSAVVHSSGNATQVIRRVCYEDDKRERDARFLMDEPDAIIAGDDAKMVAEDSSRDATLESMADVDDGNSSPERHTELFWESNSASERSDSRRPLDYSSDSDKCCKSPSYDETNSTDSSGVGTHMRLDSVIKEARGLERSASGDGSSADDTHPPLRTYPPKRLYHPLEREMERSLSGKTRAGERSPDSLEVRRRASARGVVKRGCHCCNGSPAPLRPKKPRQRKPTTDFTHN